MFISLLLDACPKSLLVLLDRHAPLPGTQKADGAIGNATNRVPGPAPRRRSEPGADAAWDRRERARRFAASGLLDTASALLPRTGKSAGTSKAGEGLGCHLRDPSLASRARQRHPRDPH